MLVVKELDVKNHASYADHERVVYFEDDAAGLKAIISVHNTNLGPSLGGCRMVNYETQDHALNDVLRLSWGMTYKSALAGLPLGGGKSVIIGDPRKDKTPALFEAMGEAVDYMGGSYITAEDVGTTEENMLSISKNTKFAAGLPRSVLKERVANPVGGNPSPYTAFGVFCGLKAAVKYKLKVGTVKGLKVGVQGIGSVGYDLCRLLDAEGATLFLTDVNEEALAQAKQDFANVHIVGLDDIYDMPVDIYAPCALGATVNDATIERLQCGIIAGAANNQLDSRTHDQALHDKGILYAPDYVINSGGVMCVGYEFFQLTENPLSHALNEENLKQHVAEIENVTMKIFDYAAKHNMPTGMAANKLAEEIFMNKGKAQSAAAV
jgi:leucine dehydrogenase